MQDQLIIFDTTMRDGEQSPGAAMTRDEKVRIGKQLERLRRGRDRGGLRRLQPRRFRGDPRGRRRGEGFDHLLARTRQRQRHRPRGRGDQAGANRGRIHTFIATSPIHMQHKLRMEPDQVLEAAVRAVKQARQYTDDVEFSAEDAVRSDMDFLCRIFEAAIKAGATTINVPDTVGYSVPQHWGDLFRSLIDASAEFGQGGVVDPLPQRPRHGGGQLARRGARRARARSSAPSTASASAPATPRSRRS